MSDTKGLLRVKPWKWDLMLHKNAGADLRAVKSVAFAPTKAIYTLENTLSHLVPEIVISMMTADVGSPPALDQPVDSKVRALQSEIERLY
ncbi:hypothetical protein EVAR_49706_1 [Eumeta japonica]|uniref:Uncharacterized protein n=1 Tax=Eumeta variegata TaxID=151549 RepID=A0A4C1Z1C7_EUMVA|nr:hypothetical protein EVAR_49706_1 [Eumeta japonica]